MAGHGTRLLPATRAIPKGLLPVGRWPLLFYAIQEAVASGADTIVLITNRHHSNLIRSYLEPDDESDWLPRISSQARIIFVEQHSPRGLADSIRSAKNHLQDDAFGVILPDALILGEYPCIDQLGKCYADDPGFWVATRRLEPKETERFGVLVINEDSSAFHCRVLQVRSIVEKPKPEESPSLFGVFGRYILEPSIFGAIDRIRPDPSGELQLSDALRLCCEDHRVYGYLFSGEHFDTGEWLGYAQAVVRCFSSDPTIGPAFSKSLCCSSLVS